MTFEEKIFKILKALSERENKSNDLFGIINERRIPFKYRDQKLIIDQLKNKKFISSAKRLPKFNYRLKLSDIGKEWVSTYKTRKLEHFYEEILQQNRQSKQDMLLDEQLDEIHHNIPHKNQEKIYWIIGSIVAIGIFLWAIYTFYHK